AFHPCLQAPAPGLRAEAMMPSNRRPIPERRRLMWFASRSHNRPSSLSGAPRRAHGSRRRQLAFRPTVAALEDRKLLSTLTVLSNNDSGPGSLRAEISAAQSGDTIRFAGKLAGQTITLTGGELVIDKDLDVEGLGAGRVTVSGNHASRVFDIQGI